MSLKGLNLESVTDVMPIQGDQRGIRELREKIAKLEANLNLADQNRPGEQAIRGWERTRIIELESEQQRLTRQVHEQEEQNRNLKRELDAVASAKLQISEKLEKLLKEHETLKSKGLELLKRNGHLESKAQHSETDKGRIVDRVQKLQIQHKEEMDQLRNTIKMLNEKLYLVNQDSKDRKTFMEIDALYNQEKKELNNRIRTLEDQVATLRNEATMMEDKLFEQHAIIKELAKSNDFLELDREKLEVMTEEFTSIKDELEVVTREREDATQEIKNLERSIHELQIRLRIALQDYSETNSTRHELLRDKDCLEQQLESLKCELNNLKWKTESLETDKRMLERTSEL